VQRKENRNNNAAQLAVDVLPPHRANPVLAMGEAADKFVYEYSCAMLNLS